MFRKVKQAPTNLVASMCKLTFKQTLFDVNEEHCHPFTGRMASCLKLSI